MALMGSGYPMGASLHVSCVTSSFVANVMELCGHCYERVSNHDSGLSGAILPLKSFTNTSRAAMDAAQRMKEGFYMAFAFNMINSLRRQDRRSTLRLQRALTSVLEA